MLGGVDGDAEVVFELLLADELVDAPGAQGGLQGVFVVLDVAGDDAIGRRVGVLSNTCAIRGNYTGGRVASPCGIGAGDGGRSWYECLSLKVGTHRGRSQRYNGARCL